MSEQLLRDIEILADLFKAGGWTELRVESDAISLLLSQDRAAPSLDGAQPASVPVAAPPLAGAQSQIMTDAPGAQASAGPIDPAWTAVKAPNLGTFYRAPKPGSPPFVEVGQRVEAHSELCLIEVMKLFTSVKAGIAGTVRHVAVADADLVEGGQPLFYIACD
ncbi:MULTISPECIES: acetyl-CoA carboxylase biotin carboxyl carrier protein [Sphingobium]|uniref:Biotin carboxyl carrier protein of acetyl-CoA carboxylase n=3 Tax=Sphingobium cupriresistens TaxID=1132417 RepID=A0A0J8ATY9_9SPHN|nr:MULTISPECIES: biotin/lipoyl-containing protein [Sphingobium]KMS57730.1 acetyl-CoA carboxylase [Sphingobium cupriresistens LL01]MBJ7376025.1 acetyl-CoA carboxylase, biotin carboxyl carrier protein [Sphingobium sp.]RYM10873.1 acetyl-CoA carboxylase, biotin carboxyl carrier protein [Sphingobium cupriresistens]WCP14821.1 Biotin carboxyl carrier protein of acetyl-CoA carboxylase [Sphingobium sp. AntQ-1]